jgi:hypothetical protein
MAATSVKLEVLCALPTETGVVVLAVLVAALKDVVGVVSTKELGSVFTKTVVLAGAEVGSVFTNTVAEEVGVVFTGAVRVVFARAA